MHNVVYHVTVHEKSHSTCSFTLTCVSTVSRQRDCCIYCTTSEIVRATVAGLVSPLMSLDLSSRFDTVDHHILLGLLSARFSLTNHVYEWFISYLTDGTQVISTHTGISKVVARTYNTRCMKKGSVVGSQQFTVCSEDVEKHIEIINVKRHIYIVQCHKS